EMPPEERLPAEVVEDFARWIDMGAPDPRGTDLSGTSVKQPLQEPSEQHWAFRPIASPSVPEVVRRTWVRGPIDCFILAELERRGLTPVADASPQQLVRRITYDLTGLPPEVLFAGAGCSLDDAIGPPGVDGETDAAARGRRISDLIDELLQSPRFGERWGRHWLDVARYGESTGGAHNIPLTLAFRYRDYVIASLNDDKPYDRFVMEQVAGDLMPADNDADRNEQLVATGFLCVGIKDLRERNTHRYQMLLADEQIDALSRGVLGLTIACAKCHDHKFDPITTRDYYALAGIFASTEPLLGVMRNRLAQPFSARPQLLAGSPVLFTDADMASMLEQSVKLTYMRLAIRDERRRLLVAAGREGDPAREQDAWLTTQPSLQKLVADLALAEKPYRTLVDRYNASLEYSALAVRDAARIADVAVHIRGEDTQLGEIVPRGIPAVLSPGRRLAGDASQSGRLELANWLIEPENPLTARVIVNRVWQHLMGSGLVETPDDFGTTGQPPSHPELLDYLATRFVEQGWSLKRLIREIMLSHTYALSTAHDAAAWEIDPDNRYRWRMTRRRLDANALRDSLLALSGQLILDRPRPVLQPWVDDLRLKSLDTASWFQAAGRHRTVYMPMLREYVPAELSVFDFPETELVTGRRDVTTVPAQALYFLNSPFVVEQSRETAEELLEGTNDDGRRLVNAAFLRILNRSPSPGELTECNHFLRQFVATLPNPIGRDARVLACAALCQTLFASAEFRYLY
ncbi:MAG: DUF1549 and DUF1553 domain-containing protein, partial [Pirellulaceae bacterium]